MQTLTIVALKGGSGKTTVATHLALAAHLRGRQVMLADTDPQASAQDVLSAREASAPECLAVGGPDIMTAQFAAQGAGKDLFVVDTAAGALEDASVGIVLADYCVLVVRPTMLDLAGLARTLMLVRRLKKPHTVVMNQAPVAREGVEAPVVKRFLRGLDYMKAPVAPAILRARSVYQTALETGRSAEEMGDQAAAREVAALWTFVEEELTAAEAAARAPKAAKA